MILNKDTLKKNDKLQTPAADTPISNIRLSILYANVETPRRGPTLSKGVTLSCGIDLEVYSS